MKFNLRIFQRLQYQQQIRMKQLLEIVPRRSWITGSTQKRKNKFGQVELFHCIFCTMHNQNRSRVINHMKKQHEGLIKFRSSNQPVTDVNQQPIFLSTEEIIKSSTEIFHKNYKQMEHLITSKITDKIAQLTKTSLFPSKVLLLQSVQEIYLQQLKEFSFSSYSNLLHKRLQEMYKDIQNMKDDITSGAWSRIKRGHSFFIKACTYSPGQFVYSLVVIVGQYERKSIFNYANKISKHIIEYRTPLKILFDGIDDDLTSFGRKVPQCDWQKVKALIINLIISKQIQLAMDILLIFHLGIPNLSVINFNSKEKYNLIVGQQIFLAYIPYSIKSGFQKITYQQFANVRAFCLQKLGVFYSLFALRKRILYSLAYQQKCFIQVHQNKLVLFDANIRKNIEEYFKIPFPNQVQIKNNLYFNIDSWEFQQIKQVNILISESDTFELLQKDSNINLSQEQLNNILVKDMPAQQKYFIVVQNYFLKVYSKALVNKVFFNLQDLLEFVDQQYKSGDILLHLKKSNLQNSNSNKINYFQRENNCSIIIQNFLVNTCIPYEKHDFLIKTAKTEILIANVEGENLYYISEHIQFAPKNKFIYQTNIDQFYNQQNIQIQQNQSTLYFTKRKPICPTKSHQYQIDFEECHKCQKIILKCHVCQAKMFHKCAPETSVPVPQDAFFMKGYEGNEDCFIDLEMISFDLLTNSHSLLISPVSQYNTNLYMSQNFSTNLNCQEIDFFSQILFKTLIDKEDFLPFEFKQGKAYTKIRIKKNTVVGILSGLLKTNQQTTIKELQQSITIQWIKQQDTQYYRLLILSFNPFKNSLSLCRISNQNPNLVPRMVLVQEKLAIILVAMQDIQIQEELLIKKQGGY